MYWSRIWYVMVTRIHIPVGYVLLFNDLTQDARVLRYQLLTEHSEQITFGGWKKGKTVLILFYDYRYTHITAYTLSLPIIINLINNNLPLCLSHIQYDFITACTLTLPRTITLINNTLHLCLWDISSRRLGLAHKMACDITLVW